MLSHVGGIYARADDTSRRLCDQALFMAIYIDEDNDARVGYRGLYDGLADTDLQVDALIWGCSGTTTGPGWNPDYGRSLVRSSHLTHPGCSALRAYGLGSHEHAR